MTLRAGPWTAHELERLVRLFPGRGEKHLAMILRRTPAAVRRKALELFRGPLRSGPWSEADDLRLRNAYGVLDRKALCVVLRRSDREVRRRLIALRGCLRKGPWLPEEDRMLKQVYGTRSDRALEVALLRPRAEIARAASRLCLAKDKRFPGATGSGPMPRWTEEQVATLRQLYRDRDNLEVARVLGRTVASVANKASQLGLRKSARLRASIGRTNVARRHRAPRSGSFRES